VEGAIKGFFLLISETAFVPLDYRRVFGLWGRILAVHSRGLGSARSQEATPTE